MLLLLIDQPARLLETRALLSLSFEEKS